MSGCSDVAGRKCFICGSATALGLGYGGHRKDRPKPGYLPYCADHADDAQARLDAAMGKPRKEAVSAQPKKAAAVSKPPQGTLDL